MLSRLFTVALLALLTPLAHASVKFSISVNPSARKEPASGRLMVMLVMEGSKVSPTADPIAAPFWDDPQPMYGIDVKDLAAGQSIIIDDAATSFPCKLSELPDGNYRAQARLDVSRTNSNWKRDAGNITSSAIVKFSVDGSDQTIVIALDTVNTPKQPAKRPGVDVLSVRSELLSTFHGRDVMIRAGVAFPLAYDPTRTYAAIYHSPGYGGDHTDAFSASRSRVLPGSPDEALAKNTFAIYLDPESPNGHTLMADSANNGPWAQALITELIPALEAKYKLVSKPEARMLRGHSSGGWSTLWLGLRYPETFGAAWSSAPDPVDFRKFQVVDIYGQPNFYYDPAGKVGDAAAELGSYKSGQVSKMTIRQENLSEEVIGPGNTSAQQWDSWFAVFGPRDSTGHPAALFNPATGEIDHAIAEQYRAYDIGHLLRTDPGRYLPIFGTNIRVLVGDQDNFSLHEAVALLKADLDRLNAEHKTPVGTGYVKILPGCDHNTIFGRPEIRGISKEMLTHLTRAGLM